MIQYGLTRSQLDCLCVITELTEATGVSPSYLEIAHEMGYSGKTAVHAMVTILAEKGWIDHLPARARSLRVLQRPALPDGFAVELTEAGRKALA